MSIAEIVRELDAEIARLEEVKKLLSGTSGVGGDGAMSTRSTTTKKARRKKRTLSAEARKRIADAQRKRWAAQKAKK